MNKFGRVFSYDEIKTIKRGVTVMMTIICLLILMLLISFVSLINKDEEINGYVKKIEVLNQLNLECNKSIGYLELENDSLLDEISSLKISFDSIADVKQISVRATSYAPFDNVSGICNDGDPTNTSTGTYPKWGTIAVDPKIIPYGTKLYVPGYGLAIAEDTGGAIRNAPETRIDLYVDTYKQAVEWGVRFLDVIVLEWAKGVD